MFLPKSFRFPVRVQKPRGQWLDDRIFDSKKRGTCRTVDAAAKRSGIPVSSLNLWIRKHCRYNEGEKIFTLRVRPPFGNRHPRVHVIPDTVLDPIAEKYRHRNDFKTAPAPATISDDIYLPSPKFGEAIGLPKKKVKPFIAAWRDKLSKLRPGNGPDNKALRSHKETSTDASRRLIEPTTWRVGDGRTILRGEESKHPSIGRPGVRRPTALNDDDARSLIERHLLEQGAQIKEKFFEFCRTHFISKRQRQRAVQRLRIRMVQIGGASNTVRYYCLPSQSPPSVLDHSPALRRAVDFLKKTLSNGPMPRRKVLRIARQHNLNTPSVLVRATLFAGVVSEKSKEHRNHVIWSLVSNGMNGHVSAMLNPAAPPQSVPTTTPAKSHKRRGPDKKVQTLNIENFCYEAKKAGKSKDFVIANDVKREFKLTSFARSSVVKYARRRAERPEDPRPWPIKR